ncbi:MAG TPA: cupin domain-containing protein [Bacteroidota bacterium]|nr:cupin domain-containing protein [Bacteroidota bacterium]
MEVKILYRLCLFVALFPLVMEAQTDTTKFTKKNCINTFTTAKIESTKAGYQYWFIDENFLDGRTVKMSVVRPHEATHAPHKHVEDEVFFILEGKAEFYLDGEWTPVPAYTSLYCPSNKMHGIRNAGDTELKYLVIKKYQKKNNPQ